MGGRSSPQSPDKQGSWGALLGEMTEVISALEARVGGKSTRGATWNQGGKREVPCQRRSLAQKFRSALRRQKHAARQGIIISCIIQANQKEGVRPEQTAVSYVKGPILFVMLLKITQEGGGGGGNHSVFILRRTYFLRNTLSADLNRHVDSTCISGFQLLPLLVYILVS